MKQHVAKNFSNSSYKKTVRLEYKFYFSIIFLMSILPSIVSYLAGALRALRSLDKTNEGIISRAWGNARVITPMIFSA